jgi:hypothetical protein
MAALDVSLHALADKSLVLTQIACCAICHVILARALLTPALHANQAIYSLEVTQVHVLIPVQLEPMLTLLIVLLV